MTRRKNLKNIFFDMILTAIIILPLYVFQPIRLYFKGHPFCFGFILFSYTAIFSRVPFIIQRMFFLNDNRKYAIEINKYKNAFLYILMPIFIIHILLSYVTLENFSIYFFVVTFTFSFVMFSYFYLAFIASPLILEKLHKGKKNTKTDQEFNEDINIGRFFSSFYLQLYIIYYAFVDKYVKNIILLLETNSYNFIIVKTLLIINILWLGIVFQCKVAYERRTGKIICYLNESPLQKWTTWK